MSSQLPAPRAKFGYYEKLSPQRQRFVSEYLIDLNAAAAAMRSGYTSHTSGWHLLNVPEIQRAISERRDLVANERGVNGNLFVLSKLWDIATADPNELMSVHRVPCRYCWGINGQYQYTKTEMDRVLKAHQFGTARQPFNALWPTGPAERAAYIAGAHKLPFDEQGGDGYTTQRDANPECSECGGAGVTLYYVGDTRKLSEQARQLYRGVKAGKDKIEVLMADQDAAISALAKHYRVATERREVWLRTVDPSKLSDEDLIQAVAELQALDLDRGEYQTVEVGEPNTNMTPEMRKQRRQASAARARAIRLAKGGDRRPNLIRRPKGYADK